MGKLRTKITSPMAKSTSPRLSDTTFFACWWSWKWSYSEPLLMATLVIRSPCYYSHFFFGRLAKTTIHFLVKKPSLTWPNFFGPLVTALMGFHCSSKKRKFAAKYGLHHTWEHTWSIRSGSHVHDVHCSGCKILMNGQKNNQQWIHVLASQEHCIRDQAQALRWLIFAEKRVVEPFLRNI